MNHRELMQSRAKKSRHAFLGLPEDLQDRVMDGLDRQELTLEAAEDLIKAAGFPLSHQAVANYYECVRVERRLHANNETLTSAISQFKDQPVEDNLRALANVLMSAAVAGVGNGSIGIKDIDLARLIEAVQQPKPVAKAEAQDSKAVETKRDPEPGEQGLSGEVADWVRKEVLGVRKKANG